MVTFVLDASAVVRFLDGEAGALRIKQILRMAQQGECRVLISAVNWGEIIGVSGRRHGKQIAAQIGEKLLQQGILVISADAERASRSALIGLTRKIPYADSFGVELAGDSSDHLLITADFDVKPAERDIRIEFLPRKPAS